MVMIENRGSKGMQIKDTIEIADRNPKTIRKHMDSKESPEYKRGVNKESKLDPFKEYIFIECKKTALMQS